MLGERRARSPTCKFAIDNSHGYEQLQMVFTKTDFHRESVETSKQDFMAMKPYIGEQLTLAL